MFSLTKLLQTSRFFINPRLVTVLQSYSNKAQILEQKLGLPEGPRRPLTPYIKFLMDTRPQVIRSNPKLPLIEITKECAKKWQQTGEETKKKLLAAYLKEKDEYLTKRAAYEKKLTAEQKQEIKAAKLDAKLDAIENKEWQDHKKRLSENEKPKKPATGHISFVRDAFKNRDRGELSMIEFSKQLGKEWRALPEAKKNVYIDAYKADRALYKQKLARWELKMIRLGNTDLVRQEALVQPIKKPTRRRRTAKTAKQV